MTLLKSFPAILVAACISFTHANAQNNTAPFGYLTINVTAGTGTVKKITPISIPFYGDATASGQIAGQISGITSTTLSNASAGWTPGELSTPATPYAIKFLTGAATGRTFLISTATANTATTVTIDAKDVAQGAMTSYGIALGDQYEIIPCDTLNSFFGTPDNGIKGGASINAADSLTLYTNGTAENFFYSTATNRWTKSTLGNPDATNTPIRPDTGIYYSRLAADDLTLVIPGRLSTTNRVAAVKNSGATALSQNWPIDLTLASAGFQNIPTWTASATYATADKIQITANGVISIYYYDGTNWRKNATGNPIANNELIPAGSAVMLSQVGTQAGYSFISQPLPYPID